jgi:hypothetical protein
VNEEGKAEAAACLILEFCEIHVAQPVNAEDVGVVRTLQ